MTVIIRSACTATSLAPPASSDSAARWIDLMTTLNSAPMLSMSKPEPSFVKLSTATPWKSMRRLAKPPSVPLTTDASASLNMVEKGTELSTTCEQTGAQARRRHRTRSSLTLLMASG